jgi:hypothetical protein
MHFSTGTKILKPGMFKTVQSPGELMATVFPDVCGVLLVDFITPSSTINAAAYLETLKRPKEAIQKKTPGLLTAVLLLLLRDNVQPHSAVTSVNLLNSRGCCYSI